MRALLVALGAVGLLHCAAAAEDADSSSADFTSGGSLAGFACGAPEIVTALRGCIDHGNAPATCLAKSHAPACDADKDGLDDGLEDAMLASYAPVFAYNGDEPYYPTNANHFVSRSSLVWRVDSKESTREVVDDHPTLDTIAAATHDGAKASSVALGAGPNFWLCLNEDPATGKYPAESLVTTMNASRQLDDGIDVFTVAHPTTVHGKDYVVLEYMLFYAYNHALLDDHEGDFEGGAVFVEQATGKVAAFYTDRHASSDDTKLIPLMGDKPLAAKDPSTEQPKSRQCGDTNTDEVGGVRFWDHAGKQHHPVLYVAKGGHASYGYPGATKIKGIGCIDPLIVKDTHDGDGPKLVPFENAYYTDWGKSKVAVEHGVRFRNLGERSHLREAWSKFAGQWGCTLTIIPKSYPGPWDNARLCRHWLTNDWGNVPPFTPSDAKDCTDVVDEP